MVKISTFSLLQSESSCKEGCQLYTNQIKRPSGGKVVCICMREGEREREREH